ncbi:MAG: cysteine hydrolase [Anaerolineaceae bacterium]|nr:cysteine hydrolase [Anaerolineaceae bacterium]
MKQKILVVVDMQNDFINGSLGTAEAEKIVPAVCGKIADAREAGALVFATMDTHSENYMNTREGRFLPVPHCIKGTSGWLINEQVAEALEGCRVLEKYSFGSLQLPDAVTEELQTRGISPRDAEIELIGLCTDICVVSNALILKARFPETDLKVDAACCAGVTPEKHLAALETMRSCQIEII